MRSSFVTILALFLASLTGAVLLSDGATAWIDGAGRMIAAGHLILTTVVVVAALVGSARWSVPLGVGLAGSLAIVAISHPLTVWAVVMMLLAAAAAAGLIGTGLRGVVRLRPPADGPPRKAAALPLALLATPVVIGGLQPAGVGYGDWLLAAAGIVIAGSYAKATPGALWLVRLGCPAMGVVAGFVVPFPQALLAIAFSAGLTWLAWSADARLAVQPLTTSGTTVPVPAELTPRDILDAAGLDEHGRRETDR